MLNESGGGPWGGGGGSGSGGSGGSGGGGNNGGGGDGLGPRNPWSQPPRKRPAGGGGPTALDELLKRGRARFGGGGGGFSGAPNPAIWKWAVGAFVLLWIVFTSFHTIGPQQRGVVTRLGNYAGTLTPGLRFTLPAPIDLVQRLDVDDIRNIDIGSTAESAQNLVLTGDQNIVDLAYSVRWNIRDPELYLFELADPDDTIREVAESAMREQLARVTLNDAIGPQRSQIEARVAERMQELLDSYRAGVAVQGVAIKQADPPAAVNDAFKEVSASQQQAQSYLNEARAYALQLTAKSQGEAAAFDKVYTEYKLAPEVTRKRMYYETMEKVLAKTDKTIVEAPGVTSYLPLGQLRPGAATGSNTSTTTATAGAAK
ncbi:FtsH protease activity modulator HflK [Sphingomonas solaris]|uniref:Protein HflK n=1 Tax=Alterirhizorhabdus solaris TaxID=2529389 RepID=A0A558QUL5_9SPHN|nr:FtsH protease activity modulator HflK [Sphingomonas solaris]TVV70809.1 FtsH protease activity modulator HflK [Sphingomonas solaris]